MGFKKTARVPQPQPPPITTKEEVACQAKRITVLFELADVYYRRTRFEHQLRSTGTEPRFIVEGSWKKFSELACALSVSKLVHAIRRLAPLAEEDSDRAMKAFRDLSTVPEPSVPAVPDKRRFPWKRR